MKFLLNGNDWEADCFVSTVEDGNLAIRPQTIKNMCMQGAVTANFIGLPGRELLPASYKVTVPGCDRSALLAAGEIPDINYDRNMERSSWAENYSWAFRKRFVLPENIKNAKRLRLRFEYLDYSCTIWLNGARLGWHCDAFMPCELDITREINRDGENILAVVFEPIEQVSAEHSHSEPAEFAWHHRSQMSYGWDWSRRLLVSGIMDDCYILASEEAYIMDAFFNGAGEKADLALEIAAEKDMSSTISIELTPLNFEGESFAWSKSVALQHGANQLDYQLDVPGARQWFPNNYGESALYTLKISVEGFEKNMQVGFRTLEMRRNVNAPVDSYALTYVVNGQEIFVRGLNWVPAEMLLSEAKEADYERLIRLAAEANFNFIRIWGGGIIEKEAFYNACDRYGIMVHQEFMHACSEYPTEGKYLAEVRREGIAVLKKVRSHVCISLICGGNEMQYYGEDPESPLLMQYAELAKIYTPHLPYHVTSPDRSRPGERHHGPWHYNPHKVYNMHFRQFASEIGCTGAPEEESVKRFIPENMPFPDSQSTRYHFLHFDPYKTLQKQWVFFDPQNRREYCQSSMLAQADTLSYLMARYRRYMPEASGCVFWQYNEPWPTFAYSIVDYYHVPKMAHYCTARVNKNDILSLEDDSWCITDSVYRGKAYLTSDKGGVFSGKITAVSVAGKVLFEEKFSGNYPCHSSLVSDIEFAVNGDEKIVFVRLELFDADGQEIFCDTRHYGITDFKELFKLENARVEVAKAVCENNKLLLTLKNSSTVGAGGVRLRFADLPVDDVYYMDNYIDLLPGEERTLTVKLAGTVDIMTETLEISGWNVPFENVSLR